MQIDLTHHNELHLHMHYHQHAIHNDLLQHMLSHLISLHSELQLHMHYHQHAIHNHVEEHIIPDLMFHMRLLRHSDYRASHSHHLLRKLLELNHHIHLHELSLIHI